MHLFSRFSAFSKSAIFGLTAIAAAVLLLPATTHAQITTSAVGGRVTTTAGAPVAEATITSVHLPTGARYAAHTNAGGGYLIPNLKPGGPYSMVVRHLGMQPGSRGDMSLTLGTTAHFNFALEQAALALSAVTVKGGVADEISSRRIGPLEGLRESADYRNGRPQLV